MFNKKEMLLIALANEAEVSDSAFIEEVLVVLWDHAINTLKNSNVLIADHMAKLKQLFLEGELSTPDEQDALYLMCNILITSDKEALGVEIITLVNKIEE